MSSHAQVDGGSLYVHPSHCCTIQTFLSHYQQHMWKSAGIPVLFSLTLALQAACQQQYLPVDALNGTAHGTQVINAELRHFIDGLLKDAKIPGLSLGVVHSGGVVEVEGFGRRSEDGARVTSQVTYRSP